MDTTELNYPIEKEMVDYEEKSSGSFERDLRRFSMRPFKAKEKATNKLFFGAFVFNKFAWFANWPDLKNYYLKLPVHRVQVVGSNGKLQRGMVICEPSMNKYASETLSDSQPVPAPFPGVKSCPFCVHSNKLWDRYKEARKAAGLEGLTTDRFKIEIQKHPEVTKLRELARSWGVQDTYYCLVFDYSKYLGEKELEEGEESLGFQAYFGPATIRDGLYNAHKAKCRFWDFMGGGFRSIEVVRDNAKGTRFCEYTVRYLFEPAQVDGNTLSYLQNPPAEDIYDPRDWIEEWTIEDKASYVKAYGEGLSIPESGSTSVARDEGVPGPDQDPAPTQAPAPRPVVRRSAPAAQPASPPTQKPPSASEAPSQEPLWNLDGAKEKASQEASPLPPPSTPEPPAPAPAENAAPRRTRIAWNR